MPPENPRKSSTSSGSPPRPRYLGLEIIGEPVPSPRLIERALAIDLEGQRATPTHVRVVRVGGRRLIVEVDHRSAGVSRQRWNASISLADGRRVEFRTRRTFGTLRKGKAWVRQNH